MQLVVADLSLPNLRVRIIWAATLYLLLIDSQSEDDSFSSELQNLSTSSTSLKSCKNSLDFPADSDFTERSTAKFSCYMMNPFDATTSRDNSGARMQKTNKIDMMEAVRIASLSTDYGSKSGSLMKEQKDTNHQPNLTHVHQEGPSNLATAAGNSSSTTRRRPNEIPMEMEEDHEPKTERNSLTVATVNPKRKQVKDITESDLVHVRARHGQATSNHSLAERVRREKINERMKLLQGLVPGCSKVTGKAVMLDEIINYVQSLQQQVEFLSMKLAAINPRLDIDREGVLPKYLLQPWNSPSAAVGFSSDILHPQLHLPQHGLIQSGLSGTRNPPDLLGRSIDTQMTAVDGYNMQVPNAWNEELHDVVQMRCCIFHTEDFVTAFEHLALGWGGGEQAK
ncbi:hypothetical protein OPV22_032819 [Ensete ventricosum]|uniref:BHLH domain-containing protein n=1 Tax=Ensete ventricosum TaxID=4639 RepID=A0AAV8PSI1_ENSVE|nr:hypothetical protein OPV22_032819 [Ensete ventricosum]